MSGKLKITGIGGSLEQNSSTLAILKSAMAEISEIGAETVIIDIKEVSFPLCSFSKGIKPDISAVDDMLNIISSSDGFVFASPEYHGTVSAAFKNVIDYFEFLSDRTPPYLTGKPVGLIAAAGAENAGFGTLETMINIVHSLRGIVAPSSLAIGSANKLVHADGSINEDPLKRKLKRLAEEVYFLSSKLKS